MSYGYPSGGSPIIEEMMTIGYLCGYVGEPSLGSLPEIVKRCVSLGPYGWGLAIMAIMVALHGGELPYFAEQIVPFGKIKDIRGIWVIDGIILERENIIGDQGFYMSRIETESTISKSDEEKEIKIKYAKPVAFGIVIAYCDRNCGSGNEEINWRCRLIQETNHPTYPWIAVEPSDSACRKMIELTRIGKFEPTIEDEIEYARAKGTVEEVGEESGEEETEEEEFDFNGSEG